MALDIAGLLKKSRVFAALQARDLSELSAQGKVEELTRGTTVWRQGSTGDQVALVASGRFKKFRELTRGQVLLDMGFPGDLLGTTAVVLQSPQGFTVGCLRRGAVLRLPGAAIRSLMQTNPAVSAALCAMLARLNERLTESLEDVSCGHVTNRLARVLLRLAERTGEAFDGGILIPLRLARADLASLAATTVESTSRQIARWNREGVVVPQPAGYLIRRPSALRALTS
jgi:CRP-like cAMP-binding protein